MRTKESKKFVKVHDAKESLVEFLKGGPCPGRRNGAAHLRTAWQSFGRQSSPDWY